MSTFWGDSAFAPDFHNYFNESDAKIMCENCGVCKSCEATIQLDKKTISDWLEVSLKLYLSVLLSFLLEMAIRFSLPFWHWSDCLNPSAFKVSRTLLASSVTTEWELSKPMASRFLLLYLFTVNVIKSCKYIHFAVSGVGLCEWTSCCAHAR